MSSLKISLRAGERLFLNGAVLRVDRRTQVELLNDVTFLLESHVMQVGDTTTPLRQLYFIVQMMMIDPADAAETKRVFDSTIALLLAAFENREVRDGLQEVCRLVDEGAAFEALKSLRALFALEEAVIEGETPGLSGAIELSLRRVGAGR